MRQKTIVTGGGSDTHIVGNRMLGMALKQASYVKKPDRGGRGERQSKTEGQ